MFYIMKCVVILPINAPKNACNACNGFLGEWNGSQRENKRRQETKRKWKNERK